MQDGQQRMVAEQVALRGVRDAVLLRALADVPREAFVAPRCREFALQDVPLPCDPDATVMTPFAVAVLVQVAGVRAGHRVLEIGTGSGYLTAVLSRVASIVVSVDSSAARSHAAQALLERLGCRNVTLVHRSASRGCPEAAPFDAIVVPMRCAGLPAPLLPQLRVGGALAMTVGESPRSQRLLRIRRGSASVFRPEALGPPTLVPPNGEEASKVRACAPIGSARHGLPDPGPVERLRVVCEPFHGDLQVAAERLAARVAHARVVLVGGASDGTREFHALRAGLTRLLMERCGFDVLALDADADPVGDAQPLAWPAWCLHNPQTRSLIESMRSRHGRETNTRIVGLDLFQRVRSLRAAIRWLRRRDAGAARAAAVRYATLTPWQCDPGAFERAADDGRLAQLLPEVANRLAAHAARRAHRWVVQRPADIRFRDRMMRVAHAHQSAMLQGHPSAWTVRNRHMAESLDHLWRSRGDRCRVVVWTSGPNAGDAGATEMGARGAVSLGQLMRERLGGDAQLVGMSSHHGSVLVASGWEGAPRTRPLPEAHRDSFERLLHETGVPHFTLPLRQVAKGPVGDTLAAPRLQRFCGAQYSAENELPSHTYQASLQAQFDQYAWFDRTEAVAPPDIR